MLLYDVKLSPTMSLALVGMSVCIVILGDYSSRWWMVLISWISSPILPSSVLVSSSLGGFIWLRDEGVFIGGTRHSWSHSQLQFILVTMKIGKGVGPQKLEFQHGGGWLVGSLRELMKLSGTPNFTCKSTNLDKYCKTPEIGRKEKMMPTRRKWEKVEESGRK